MALHTINSPAGTITVNPERGAKITSLRSSSGLEWLTTEPARIVDRPGEYGFTEAEMCGWDECAPTINACTLADGRRLGDHGDVWDQPWQVTSSSATHLQTSIEVDELDFHLTRTITATPTGFRLDYRAEALRDTEVPFLWAAHPQFAMPDDLRLTMPKQLKKMFRVHPVSAGMVPVSKVPMLNGSRVERAEKYWGPAGWLSSLPSHAVLSRDGGHLTMSWGGRELRGVALWFDPAEFAQTRCLAIEPSTGTDDDASTLVPGLQVPELIEGQPLEWWIELVLTD